MADEIKIVTDDYNETIDFPSDLNEEDIRIELRTPRRKAPIRKKKRITRQLPPEPYLEEEDPTMDAFINPAKQQIDEEEMSFGGNEQEEYEDDNEPYREQPTYTSPVNQVPPSKGYDTVDNERIDLLSKFARLDAKGINLQKRFTAYSDIHEMRTEYQRLTYSSQLEASIKFQRRVLMAASTGMEFCNKRYNPFDVQLDGWSENVMENIDEYDNIFEELFVKYRESVQVAPEIRLLMTLGGSAMMFHFTKTMFQAAMPSMNDVVKQNPDLVRNMVNAVAKTAQKKNDDPPQVPGARREMKAPDVDMSSLFSSLMPMMGAPPPLVEDNGDPTRVDGDDDDIESLISSVESVGDDGEIKNVSVEDKKKKRRRKKADQKIVEI